MVKIFSMFVMFVVILFVPLISIWSVNVLFLTEISYSVSTWFASMWLILLIANQYKREKQV